MRKLVVGALIVAALLGGAFWTFNALRDGSAPAKPPVLAEPPPLKAVARASSIIMPVAVPHAVIRDAMEAHAPRNLTGKRDNPLNELLGKTEIGWNITRSPLTVGARSDSLLIATNIGGQLRAAGKLSNQASQITGQLGNMLGGSIGREIGKLGGQQFDQTIDIAGNVAIAARPILQPNWRIEPQLATNVTLADRAITVGGIRLNVIQEVKPLLDRTVNEQMAKLQDQLRNDPTLEQTVRREWSKMCRSISLGPAGPDMPALWLEVKPKHALAAQPQIDAIGLTLTLGVHADTRIVPNETKPDCPFPAQLQLVPAMEQGKVAITVPIDLPFTELSRILEAQLKDRVFPQDPNAAVQATVQKAAVAASGDRLLISLRVKGRERSSWFALGAEADVFVWGKPQLDSARQVLRFADMTLAIESEGAFGLAGAAGRAVIPYLQHMLTDRAVVDLRPLTANARKSIEATVAGFQKQTDGIVAETAITGVRLVGLEFDAKTLRIVAEVEGTARAQVTRLQ